MQYGSEIQELFLRYLISDSELFARCRNIIDPRFFYIKYQKAIELLSLYSEKYNAVPDADQVFAVAGLKLELIDVKEDQVDWFLEAFETFCRHKALEIAIIESSDLLQKEEYGTVEKLITEASQVGLVKDLGLEYFDNPRERLEYIKSQGGGISTGWKGIDAKLYGGFNRKELSIFCGGSGAGKSLFLQNLGLNWVGMNLNVVYISLELSEQMISLRLDAMLTGKSTKEVMRTIDDVELTVGMQSKTSGRYRVKYMPSGSTANDIRSYLREYEIETGVKVDAVLVDYLDLMSPINTRIRLDDAFTKDKYVSEELRNMAAQMNIMVVTASQLNRSAVEEMEYDHSHIAGGISKINTADNVIGIFTSNAMRENGRYTVQFLKTRSSSGVGAHVDLAFNPDTMRITDLPEGETVDNKTHTAASLVNKFKRDSVIASKDEDDGDDVKTKMMDMHSFLKNNDL